MDQRKASRKTRARVPTFIRNQMPYGPPVWDAVASGNLKEMRSVAREARQWLGKAEGQAKEVRAALRDLERAIQKLER